MTYRELLDKLSDMREELLDDNVCVIVNDEVHPMYVLDFAQEDDVLDAGHPFLM